MERRITLRDIARRLEVSTSAVSLALRGSPRIASDTAERIRREAEAMGYIPNRAAAGLRTARSDIVAVSLNDLSNPVFNEFLVHIEDELRAHGKIVFLGVAREDTALQRAFVRSAIEQGVSGLLICPVRGASAADLGLAAAPLPCAAFSRALDGLRTPQFVNDDEASGRLAARALLDAGRRRPCWLGGGQPTSTARARQAGFEAALREAGVAPAPPRHGPTSRRFGFDAAREALTGEAAPDAFACFSDLIAFGVLSACHALGLAPGRDLSVIGCDDMEEAAFANPPLSTIRVDTGWIGRSAARCLIDAEAGSPHPPGVVACAPKLVDRATVAAAQPVQP